MSYDQTSPATSSSRPNKDSSRTALPKEILETVDILQEICASDKSTEFQQFCKENIKDIMPTILESLKIPPSKEQGLQHLLEQAILQVIERTLGQCQPNVRLQVDKGKNDKEGSSRAGMLPGQNSAIALSGVNIEHEPTVTEKTAKGRNGRFHPS